MVQAAFHKVLRASLAPIRGGALTARRLRSSLHSVTHRAGASHSPDSVSAPVTDETVPEGHRGLHSALYGEAGSEVHGTPSKASSGTYIFREGEDDGSSHIPVETYMETRDGERPVGVFAIYDARSNLQYVSYSRNVVLAVRAVRARVPEDRCAFVRVMVFANRSMQTRESLQREADNWLAEAGTLPPGNGTESDLWRGAEAERLAAMSVDEATEYEEKKLKMQLAMGNRVDSESNISDDGNDARRHKMKAALERSDWSEVIDGQTAETIAERRDDTRGQIVTPFARASVHRTVGSSTSGCSSGQVAAGVMDVQAVDRVLDEVRPYLIADGGNVDVVSVHNGIVALQLQGACGSCPSSSATMKMGIERSLQAAFGDQLREVVQVGGPADTSATAESVDMHLNMLRGAIAAYGGGIEVVEVGYGQAVLRFDGPKPIAYGVVAALKDKFPDILEVLMLDKESGEPIQF